MAITAELLETRCRAAGHAVTLLGYVRPDVCAELVGKSRGTLKNWRAVGRGPRYLDIYGSVFYPLEAIAEFLASFEVDRDAVT